MKQDPQQLPVHLCTTWLLGRKMKSPVKCSFEFFFLGPHLEHMEVPRLGSNWSCSCWPMPWSQQRQIQVTSETCTTLLTATQNLNEGISLKDPPQDSQLKVS